MSQRPDSILSVLEDTASSLQKTQVNLKKCPKQRLTKGYIEARLKCINDYWNTFKNAHLDLCKCVPKEKKGDYAYFVNEDYFIYEDLYLCLQGDLKDMLEQSSNIIQLEQSNQCQDKLAQVHLPKIQIPVFAGKYEEWPTFQDLFISLVHNNTSINNVQKLHYLKTSVTGEPEALLRHIQVTDSNYIQAWEVLRHRYGNKRLIITSVLKRLFNQKKINTQSASQIRLLLDVTNECLNNLNNLKISTDSWDPIIIFLVIQKLDSESHKDWEQFSFKENSDELPTWADLKRFLEGKFRTLELVTPTTSATSMREKIIRERTFHITSPVDKVCIMCNENHTLCHCKEFIKLQLDERSEFVKKNNLCYNCLIAGHAAFKCRMQMSCRVCKRRHHTLLHKPRNANQSDNTQSHHCNVEDTKKNTDQDVLLASHFASKKSTALLATALVPVRDEYGQITVLRALIDQGSQGSFITERAAQLLRLKRTPVKGTVTGVGATSTVISQLVCFEVLSRSDANFNLKVQAYVMSTRITTNLPLKSIPTQTWPHLEGLILADPSFNQPGQVDLLLGVEVCAEIMKNDIIKGPPGTPCAQNTSLGWILFGRLEEVSEEILVMHHHLDLDNMLKNMWELEPSNKKEQTAEEKKCEEIYEATHSRTDDGRYIVKLPTKTEKIVCTQGRTRDVALRRFKQLERSFEKNPILKEEYIKVMEEYLETDHMEEVPEGELDNPAVYLPHHAVIREDKITTKYRIVFDASSKGMNSVSLNDELLVGPQLQEDLRNIIMRWRMKRVCFVADIEKMYRQVLVTPTDADFQRILWRPDISGPVKDYRLLRLTFGNASAAYLAVRSLIQVAQDEGQEHPVAARTIIEDFYMDDLMSGQDTVSDAIEVAKAVQSILQKGGFPLQKWASNSAHFLQHFQSSEINSNVNIDIKVDGTIRALGLSWSMGQDAFQYHVNLPSQPTTVTKRNILADIQKLFDPLGWIAPSIVPAKLIVQQLWLTKCEWDDEIDINIKNEWLNIRQDFQNLNEISLRRWLCTNSQNIDEITVHGFCDSSERAYGAVAYMRVRSEEGQYVSNIIAAKGRVSPVKPVSLPRLELCGAVLLSTLLKQIKEATRIPSSQFYAWTDSTIVLSWLRGDPTRWKTFVRNRVVTILDNTDAKWYHVKSQENPADIVSRGMRLTELKSCKLWWEGPEWLKKEEINLNRPENLSTDLESKQHVYTTSTNLEKEINFESDGLAKKFENFHTIGELLKTITYCRRFLYYKKEETIDINKPVTVIELSLSLKKCIKIVQREKFSEEIDDLQKTKRVKKRSILYTLNPYLDEDCILRVSGRISQADYLSEDTKHPIILDGNDYLTALLIKDAHRKTLHGGLQLTLNYLRSKYWILKMKGRVKNHIHKCLVCARQNAVTQKQLMGSLPKERVTPARPFMHSGVDFAGPYHILMSKGRGMKTTKGYIAIFICLATKSIHLEMVGDMTSEAFIGAFKRFVARRGKCSQLWSDQGRNFVGANKELIEAWNEAKLEFTTDIAEMLAEDGTQWHFIPAYSPNFGGLWEAGVKSMKYHLKRILTTHLTFEEMATILSETEACLNSRPLCPIEGADTETIDVITPGHFLIGEAPINVPSPSLNQIKISHLSRWQHTQKLTRDLWHRWQQEYLSRLQQRPKWLKPMKEFELGNIVLIKVDNLPPGKWMLGRIVDKHPGPDGLTRVYSVKSGSTVCRRSITKLCPLPVDTSS